MAGTLTPMSYVVHEQKLTTLLAGSDTLKVPGNWGFKEQRLRELDIKHSSTANQLCVNLGKSLDVSVLIFLVCKMECLWWILLIGTFNCIEIQILKKVDGGRIYWHKSPYCFIYLDVHLSHLVLVEKSLKYTAPIICLSPVTIGEDIQSSAEQGLCHVSPT